MTVNFQPIYDRVLVEKRRSGNKTETSILYPDARPQDDWVAIKNRDGYWRGTIVAIGQGKHRKPHNKGMVANKSGDIYVGQKVLWNAHLGHEIYLDGKEYILMNFEDLMGEEVE